MLPCRESYSCVRARSRTTTLWQSRCFTLSWMRSVVVKGSAGRARFTLPDAHTLCDSSSTPRHTARCGIGRLLRWEACWLLLLIEWCWRATTVVCEADQRYPAISRARCPWHRCIGRAWWRRAGRGIMRCTHLPSCAVVAVLLSCLMTTATSFGVAFNRPRPSCRQVLLLRQSLGPVSGRCEGCPVTAENSQRAHSPLRTACARKMMSQKVMQ